jgi:hypothetical protein
MIPKHAEFLQAIQDHKKVWVKFYSQADSGVLERTCAPLDYGLGGGNADGLHRYWLWDEAGNPGAQHLGLLPQQIVDLTILGEGFDPAQFARAPAPGPVVKNDSLPPAPSAPAGGDQGPIL